MAHEFLLTRISNDFKTAIEISESELHQMLDRVIEYRINENSKPFYSIEINEDSIWTNILWYSPKSGRLFQNSKYFMENPNLIRNLKFIADELNTIVFGDEGELYYIPSFGQIEEGNFFNQMNLSVMELAENNLRVDNKLQIRNYIKQKKHSM